MEAPDFIFDITPMDTASLFPEVVTALSVRTEQASRKSMPGIWKVTDSLNAYAQKGREQREKEKKTPVRSIILSIFCILLGLFLFIPGVTDPKNLTVPLVTGAFGIAAGILSLLRLRKRNPRPQPGKNRFEKAAHKLLEGKDSILPGKYRVIFTADGMRFAEDGTLDLGVFEYQVFESVVETAHLFLLTYQKNVAVLQKSDLTSGTPKAFRQFISEKTAVHVVYEK